jgi:hypothetical protein
MEHQTHASTFANPTRSRRNGPIAVSYAAFGFDVAQECRSGKTTTAPIVALRKSLLLHQPFAL